MIKEYVIFPIETINITQRHYSAPTHQNLKAIDIAGEGTGIESAYAPSTCKVLNCLGVANTVYFGTCDSNGDMVSVMCEDGVMRVLTYAFTHDNDISDLIAAMNNGTIFTRGMKIYDEGTAGDATGNHIHFEVGEGWIYSKQTINGIWQMPNSLFPHQVFYQLTNWNLIKNLNGYTFTTVNSRTFNHTLETATVFKLKANQQPLELDHQLCQEHLLLLYLLVMKRVLLSF